MNENPSAPEGPSAAGLSGSVSGPFIRRPIATSLLGIAEGTSKSQVHKARMRLRGLLGREPTGGTRA